MIESRLPRDFIRVSDFIWIEIKQAKESQSFPKSSLLGTYTNDRSIIHQLAIQLT